jgi:hypothetical protein
MTTEILITILIMLARVEQPQLDATKNARYLASIRTMASAYVEVGNEGALVSPSADAALLAAIGYEESRHRTYIEDGDCAYPMSGGKVCDSIGPMQLSRAINRWPEFPQFAHAKPEHMRSASDSVAIAYDILVHYKQKCGKSPAVWLSAYAMGRCPSQPIKLGKRRAALAWAIAHAAGFDGMPRVIAPDAKTRRKVAALTTDKVEE